MEKKIIILANLFIFSFFISCKNEPNNELNLSASKFDTIYYETTSKVDTILFPVKNTGKSIWINKILFKKNLDKHKIIIAYSLSDNNYIYVDNLKNSLNKKILGADIKFNKESLKDYEILKIENKSFNSGKLINSVNIFYIDNKLQKIKNQEFYINSSDNGKTFDKSIDIVKNSDTIYYEIK